MFKAQLMQMVNRGRRSITSYAPTLFSRSLEAPTSQGAGRTLAYQNHWILDNKTLIPNSLIMNSFKLRSIGIPINDSSLHHPVPTIGQENINEIEEDKTIYMDSVLRKRRLKMKKHKLRKRRKAQRSLKRRLGKL